MRDTRNFRMPNGAELVGRPGKSVRIQVSVPSDGDGFFGRQCPDCSLIFRMDMQQYKALPDDLTLWCVYCGYHAEHSNFLTQQQRKRLIQAAGNYGMQKISRRLGKALLREQGVFTRNWVDTVENVVGVVEALASSLFHAAVPDAGTLVRGKGAIFQRLDPMADLLVDAGFPDLRPVLGQERWQRLLTTWAARHVFTHNDGIVDDKYLAKVPNSSVRAGQRLVLTEGVCRQAIEDTKALCEALVDALG
ncbi:hypothetical protein ACH4VX_24555 [Streptomyces sp. NPDC020731]|uniref:hypothetical protein n=1 Tax=Streptomyces sp. NPDC020731 TaxID=3365085 RepID=UPI0037967F4A